MNLPETRPPLIIKMTTMKKMEEKAKNDATASIRMRHYDEWYAIYKNRLRIYKLANRSNMKILNKK